MQFFGFISALLFGVLAAAAPINVVWVTQTDVDVVTVAMTRTVWVGAGETHAAVASSTSSSVYVAPTTSSYSSVYVAPSSSSFSSVYVAPTPSSSSVYVAPTSSSVYVAPSSSSVYVAPTTSSTSVYVAPTTSSSVYVAPTTSSSASITASAAVEEYAQSSTSSAAASSSTSSSSSSSLVSNGLTGIAAAGEAYTGDLTWYATGEGACGWTNTASDHIVAISEIVFDNSLYETANPNDNPLCGQYVSITGKDGIAYKAKVVDRCTGCAAGDLDLSEDFFNLVTSNGDGRVSEMAWVWV